MAFRLFERRLLELPWGHLYTLGAYRLLGTATALLKYTRKDNPRDRPFSRRSMMGAPDLKYFKSRFDIIFRWQLQSISTCLGLIVLSSSEVYFGGVSELRATRYGDTFSPESAGCGVKQRQHSDLRISSKYRRPPCRKSNQSHIALHGSKSIFVREGKTRTHSYSQPSASITVQKDAGMLSDAPHIFSEASA